MQLDRRGGVHFAVLGSFDARLAQRPIPLGGLRQRSVLALLLLNVGQVVPVDRLVDEVWEGRAPRAVGRSVQVYVSRLRKLLGGEVPLVSRAAGYLLDVDRELIDAERFERQAADGRRAGERGDEEAAAKLLRSALALWRGPALADFPQRWARSHATRLEELRQVAVEARIDADLALGRHAELVSELAVAVNEHPLRERLHEQRMLALYRCGRQAEALDAYRQAYRLLAEERGIDPGGALREMEAAILRQDARLQTLPRTAARTAARASASVQAVRPVPAQLPADVADFTGRAAELATLGTADGGDPPARPVTVVVGPAGVGKTALAVHWARRVAAGFPDGQLYLELRGYHPGQRVSPADALARLLRALGVDPKQVPPTEDEAAALYRSLVAERRMLVVLDNAASAEQVRPLLPGGPGCVVVVTSRDRLTGLVARDAARRITLDVLVPADASELLERILGASRVRAEPEAVAQLAGDCDHLPLALRITAANLLDHRHRSVAEHLRDFRAGDRLAALRIDGDETGGIRAAFEQSYATLSPPARRVFRLLGLVPGADVTAGAAAALADTTARAAGELLDRLAGAHLVDQPGVDRYAFHDLLRRFARERAVAEDDDATRAAAVERLYDWYLGHVDAGARLLYPQMLRLPLTDRPGVLAASFADRAEALAWLDAERANLVSAVVEAARAGPRPVAWLLADGLRGYSWIRRYTVDWLSVARAGQAAARAAGAARAGAAMEISLAMAHRCLSDYVRGAEHYDRARVLSEQAGWPLGQAAAMNNVSCVYVRLGRLELAEEYLLRALQLNEGQQHGGPAAAANIGNLGYVYLRLGRLADAEGAFTESLARRRALDDRYGQADALQGLGECHHALGRFAVALRHLDEAFAQFREVGGLDGEALIRCAYAALHCDAGRYAEAEEHGRRALDLVERTTDRYSEALIRNRLGAVRSATGDHATAAAEHSRALALARRTEGPYPHVEALTGLAAAALSRSDPDEACRSVREAVAVARRVGLRILEGHALTALASSHLLAGDRPGAGHHARSAAQLHRRTGCALGEARALTVLGEATGGDAAAGHWQQALAIAARVGAPEVGRIAALLDTVPARELQAAGHVR